MHSYRLSPEAINRLQRRVWPMYLVLLALYPLLLMKFESLGDEPLNAFLRVGAAAVLFLILYYVGGRIRRRIRDRWSTFILRLDETHAIRRQLGSTDMELHKDEVTRIVKRPGKGITLQTSNPLRSLFIPAGIENYEHARAVLAKWGKEDRR